MADNPTRFVGGEKPVPVGDPEQQKSFALMERLAAIRGAADKSRCAICGRSETTDDVYGFKIQHSATSPETMNQFHLCALCVPMFEWGMKALMRLGQQGTR